MRETRQPVAAASAAFHTGTFAVADQTFAIRSNSEELCRYVDVVLAALAVGCHPDAWWYVTEQNHDRWAFATESGVLARGLPDALIITIVQGEINRRLSGRACSQGYVVVHAGAVILHGRTVLIPATSGAGKSTLVAALLRRGAVYLSDEFAVVDPSTHSVHPYPKPLTIKAGTQQFTDMLGLSPPPFGERFHHDRWHVPVEFTHPSPTVGAEPLMVFLDPKDEGAQEPRDVHPADALVALAEHSPCRDQSAAQFRLLAELARKRRGYRLSRDHPATLAEIVDRLAGSGDAA